MKKKTKKVIIVIILILAVIAALCAGIYLATVVYNDYIANQKYEDLTSEVDDSDESVSKENYVGNPIDFDSLNKINPEIFAWLYIPDTNVDYPLLQSEQSDDYYLHTDIYGDYSYAGSIYAEYCNSTELNDRVTVLYGHNMANGSMFATLHKFEDSEFFDEHEYFYIYTPDRKLTYQIVSAYNYDDRHIMNSFNFAENSVFKQYLKYIQNPRSTVKNVRDKLDHKLTVNDKVVTLSTCLNSGDGRYLVQGVLIKDEYTE